MQDFKRRLLFKLAIPLCIFLLPFFIPFFYFNFDISTLLTVASLTFTILVGFFIAAATTNYLNLKNLLAEEDGGLIVLHNLASVIDKQRAEKVADAIDVCNIASLDYELEEYGQRTEKEFLAVLKEVDAINPSSVVPEQTAALNYLHEVKSNLIKTRQAILTVAPRIVYSLHWYILAMLSFCLIVLLLGLRDGSILLNLIVGFLSLTMYLILLLLYEVDGNFFAEESLFLANQQVFIGIGKPPYFPQYAVESGRIKNLPREYRLGVYKNYPATREKEIRVVKR